MRAIGRNDPNTLDMLLAFYWESFFRKDSPFLIFFFPREQCCRAQHDLDPVLSARLGNADSGKYI